MIDRRPQVKEFRLLGKSWWVGCARFATARHSEAVYKRLLKLPRGELGFYRMGLPEEGPVLIAVVTLVRSEADRAIRLLASGTDEWLPDGNWEAMCLRRARVVVEAVGDTQGGSGRIRIRHAGRGARLDAEGHMHEPEPGQG